MPAADELADRLPTVCGVIHSLYTAGHAPVDGRAAYDVDVCAEAVRLAELLHALLPDQPMPAAVLALLLLTDARRPARLDERGSIVTLDEQDRGRWDAAAIARGIALLNDSLRRSHGQADAYQLQAAIAAEHARGPSYDDTDWQEILRLYDLLVSIAPSDAAGLGRVVAATEATGPATGLAMLAELPPSPRWHAVRGELLAREGRYAAAARELAESLDGPATNPEQQHRERRREAFLQLAVRTPPDERGSPDVPGNAGSSVDRVFSAVGQRVLTMHPGDEEGRMLRSPGLKTAGKFYAFATPADLVVKLPSARVADLIARGRGLPCSPRPGRPMKEWVRIPAPDEEACLYYLLEARTFVSAVAENRRD